jgi:hypothetical protein
VICLANRLQIFLIVKKRKIVAMRLDVIDHWTVGRVCLALEQMWHRAPATHEPVTLEAPEAHAVLAAPSCLIVLAAQLASLTPDPIALALPVLSARACDAVAAIT